MPTKTRTFHFTCPGLALLAVAMPAQQTWVVDPNGTGNFTDLHVAIQTAASGDTLLLRGGGHYPGTYSFQKHLSFLRVPPGRPLVNRFQMPAAPATSLAVVGMDVTRITTEVPTSLEDVQLEQCDVNASHTFLNRCTIGQPSPTSIEPILSVHGGTAQVNSSTLYGGKAWAIPTGRFCQIISGQPPIEVLAGAVSVANSTLIGTPPQILPCPTGPVFSPGGWAMSIHGSGSTARITQSTLTAGNTFASVSAGSGTTVYHDTATQFTPAFTGTPAFLPTTRGDGAQPGGTITCHAQTEPGYPAVLAASLGTHPATGFPAINGSSWIDPNAFVVLVIGYADATGQLQATIPVPASAPRGLPITVQAAVAPPNAGLSAATPVVVHVR